MKTIFRSLTMAAFVAGIAVTGALAQNVCDDLDGATAKYEAFTANYQKKTEAEITAAIAAGKEFLEKWGACESWKEQVAFVKPWIPRLEKVLEAIKDGPMFAGFDDAVNKDNVEGIYSFGKQILAKYPNNHNIKYVMAVAALQDVSKAAQAKTQSKFASEATAYAKTLHEGLKSGSITLDRKLKDGTPSIGVLKHETNKEDALSRLVFTQGFINYYGLNNKKAAMPYYYEAAQLPGFYKTYSPVFATIGAFYMDEAAPIGAKIADGIKRIEAGKTDEEKEKVSEEVKGYVAQYNGYLERAMDAYGRAHKFAKDADKNALLTLIKDLYERRTTKTEGAEQWVATAIAKPMPDPTTAVQPVQDPEPTTTTTTTTGTGAGVGAASGTGAGAATGTGVGAAKGTGVGAASGNGVAPKAGVTAKKPRR